VDVSAIFKPIVDLGRPSEGREMEPSISLTHFLGEFDRCASAAPHWPAETCADWVAVALRAANRPW